MYPKERIKIVKKKGEKKGKKSYFDQPSEDRRNKKRKTRDTDEDLVEVHEMLQESDYATKNSQNEILPYGSLKKSDPYATVEERKRPSNDGDFSKVSRRAIDSLQHQYSNPQNEINNIYYEPGKQQNFGDRTYEYQRAFNSKSDEATDKINISDESLQNTGEGLESMKVEMPSKKAQRRAKNEKRMAKYSKPKTFVENSQTFGFTQNNPESSGRNKLIAGNDSMSSNHSSLNKSLKMQQRRTMNRNPLNLPLNRPQTYIDKSRR